MGMPRAEREAFWPVLSALPNRVIENPNLSTLSLLHLLTWTFDAVDGPTHQAWGLLQEGGWWSRGFAHCEAQALHHERVIYRSPPRRSLPITGIE
jgi:hypothetical protein